MKCKFCGCFMQFIDNSYLSENGWFEDEGYVCKNENCPSKNKAAKRS